jgi:tetratricopeptide (TPR) repeat protein
MRPWPKRLGALALVSVLCGKGVAHEGPEAEIEEITVEIARFGESAERLLQRAIEYRVLGRLKEAANDLQRAARLETDRPGLRRELARVQEGLGQTNEALATTELGLNLKGIEPDERAALLALKAGLLAAKGKSGAALESWTEALRLQPENVDWHHSRSQLLRELARHDERLKRLDEAIATTGSGMLEVERIDALLDAGRWAEALPRIDFELDASRLRGSWLLRRGRALLGMSRESEARKDLEAASAEIRARLGPGIREASLLAEVGLAEELLGHVEEAKRWFGDALAAGAGSFVRERLEKLKAAKKD